MANWNIGKAIPPAILKKLSGFTPIQAQLIYNRGITNSEFAEDFAYGYVPYSTDPFLMKDMDKLVERVKHAIRNKEIICVYGDYDCDGVTSTTLMVQALGELGANVFPYIPHRIDEGYGLHNDALDEIKKLGAKLVVSVDCGIRANKEADYAREIKLDLIITDHHSIGEVIPNALAVVNPKQNDCAYPEDMLAGVGVACKVAQALLGEAFDEENYLDLVAIGTVADLVPLDRFENRYFVKRGLEVAASGRRPSIAAMIDVFKINRDTMDANTIAFNIAPRINSAGRLESASLAYDLLHAGDYYLALELAEKLENLNLLRRSLTEEAYEAVNAQIQSTRNADDPLIFYAGAGIKAGIIGLVASRFVEQYGVPTFILTKDDYEAHGSSRSPEGANLSDILDLNSKYLISHGGHAQAAGLKLLNKNIDDFYKSLRQTFLDKGFVYQGEVFNVDAELNLSDLSLKLISEVNLLQPFGQSNPTPLFCFKNLALISKKIVGSKHLKMVLADNDTRNITVNAIAFGMADMERDVSRALSLDIIGSIDINEWNGKRDIQILVRDLHLTN